MKLGTEVPIYDITSLYKPEDSQSLLVNSQDFGSVLAEKFSPDHNVVLMANHGFTTVGTSIRQAVRSYLTLKTEIPMFCNFLDNLNMA